MLHLFLAIAVVESGCNPGAVNEAEQAVGVVQIRQCCVWDVNRICKAEGYPWRFTLEDRYSIGKSYIMFRLYLEHYGKGKTCEEMARIWNGGPDGHKQPETLRFVRKVRAAMKPSTVAKRAARINIVRQRVEERAHDR